jgi:hypothetical protein
MACSEAPELVTFRGGFIANWAVVYRLNDLQARGCIFVLEDAGRFRVIPPDRLTAEDVMFLRQHRDEARQIIAYDAHAQHEGTQ